VALVTSSRIDRNPVDLDKYLIEKYEWKWLEWIPQTCWAMLESDQSLELTEQTKNTINALKVLHLNRKFWDDWTVFEKICITLNARVPRFVIIQSLSPWEIEYALRIIQEIRKEEFDETIYGYIGAKLLEHDYIYVPLEFKLSMAQTYLDRLSKRSDLLSLKDEIKEKWIILKDQDPRDITIKFELIDLQIAKFLKIKDYLSKMNL